MCIQITTTTPCHHTELLAWQYSTHSDCNRTETKCPLRSYKIRKPYGANCGVCRAAEEGRKRETKKGDTKTKDIFDELRKMEKGGQRQTEVWRLTRGGDGAMGRDGDVGADRDARTEVDWEKLGLKGLRFVGAGDRFQNQGPSQMKAVDMQVQVQEEQVVKEKEKEKKPG